MADINERLRVAAEAGYEHEIKALLKDTGFDALSRDKYGMTALMHAAHHGNEGCVRLLLPTSDTLAKAEGGLTALMWAAYQGHEACVRLLLPVSDASAKANNGKTALMLTANRGHEGCVQLLLPASDALTTTKDGKTASALARDFGYESLAQFIDAYALSQSERTSIDRAANPGAPRSRAALRV